MQSDLEKKLIEVYKLIEQTCNSSVRRFDTSKGHSSRSVGFTAFEERQKKLRDLSKDTPDIIEFHCRKGSHDYFKFNGKTLKIISSPRENLTRNVFDKNSVERDQDEFACFDPLIRIVYQADYNISNHEATILESHYLEIDRNTDEVLKEINLYSLAKDTSGYVSGISDSVPEAVELQESNLLPSKGQDIKDQESE